jgi:hypothetical protein
MQFHKGMNGTTLIIQKYYDLDREEYLSKDELMKRFDHPKDYYLCYDSYCIKSNEQTLTWVYSKGYFTIFDIGASLEKHHD